MVVYKFLSVYDVRYMYFAYIRMNACPAQTLWHCTQPCGEMLPMSPFTGVCISTVSDMEQDYQSRGEQFIQSILVHVGACGCMWVHIGACGCMWVCMMHPTLWLEMPSQGLQTCEHVTAH